MAITFNRDHLSPVTITSAISAEHLIEDDYTNWYRQPSWDAEGKMAFYIPDSSIGARILLTQDQLDAILTGNTHGEIILTAKEEAAQQHREAQMPACRALVADMFSRSADRKQITVDKACEILFDLYMNSDTEVPDTMHAELFAELWNELATTTEEEEQTMTMYVPVCTAAGAQVAKIQPDGYSLYEYFTGYDFMGSADWTTDASEAKLMSLEEAEQIAQDLTDGEAASFEAIDVDDLDDILREDQPDDDFTVDPDEYFEDPLMKQLQLALDAAVADRDETGNRWKALTEEPGATELECHRAYTRYEHSQGYLEGLTNGIFAAGYNIRTDVDTTKMTVTK